MSWKAVENTIAHRIEHNRQILFTTNADLWQAYLNGLPAKERQYHNCNCCKKFIERYGGLVTLDEDGVQDSFLWGGMWGLYGRAFDNMKFLAQTAKITGVFNEQHKDWGTAVTGVWTHFHGTPAYPYKGSDKTQEIGMLRVALKEFKKSTILKAVQILELDDLDRSEKTLGHAKWLIGVHGLKKNKLWRAVADAPDAYCHVKASMIGSLLEDIEKGMDYTVIRERWNKKMHPLQYMRPSVCKPGTLKMAKVDERFLARRFATLEEADRLVIWRASNWTLPQVVPTSPKRVTWEKMPKGKNMYYLPNREKTGFGSITTGPDEPVVFKWGHNLSWFQYHSGTFCQRWNLMPNIPVMVKAILQLPEFGGIMFVLDNCRNVRYDRGGCFFPENFLPEYHSIRSLIEQEQRERVLTGISTASGLIIERKGEWDHRFLVDGKTYILDRWE